MSKIASKEIQRAAYSGNAGGCHMGINHRGGRIEYVDGGPPGRLAPVRHVAEDMDVVISRVEAAVQIAKVEDDWAYSCWIVNTDEGNVVAREAFDRDNQV